MVIGTGFGQVRRRRTVERRRSCDLGSLRRRRRYRHFMLEELHEQPARWRPLMGGRHEEGEVHLKMGAAAEELSAPSADDRGLGTSWHASLVGKYARAGAPGRRGRYGSSSATAPDGRTKSLCVASPRRQTADTLARSGRERLGLPIAICNVQAHDHAEARHCSPTRARDRRRSQAFTSQIVALALCLNLGRLRGTLTASVPGTLGAWPAATPHGERDGNERAMTVGQVAVQYPTVVPGARHYPIAPRRVKMKESHIHAENIGGRDEARPISLMRDLPVVALARRAVYEDDLERLKDGEARGGTRSPSPTRGTRGSQGLTRQD